MRLTTKFKLNILPLFSLVILFFVSCGKADIKTTDDIVNKVERIIFDIDGDKGTIELSYDLLNRVVEKRIYAFDFDSVSLVTKYSYQSTNRIPSLTETKNRQITVVNNKVSIGEWSKIESTSFEFDNKNRVSNIRVDNFITESFEYDINDEIIRQTSIRKFDNQRTVNNISYNNGNISVNEKYWQLDDRLELIRKQEFKFDNNKNPFKEIPFIIQLWRNYPHALENAENNVIEIDYISNNGVKYIDSRISYEYNNSRLPIKMIILDSDGNIQGTLIFKY